MPHKTSSSSSHRYSRSRSGRPSTGTIIALAALFVSLGGTALAARSYVITSTSQIKPSVLRQLRAPIQATTIAGMPGSTGATGVEGPAGPVGPTGQLGSPGRPGERGEKGQTGSQGEHGERGDAGVGEQGARGERGEKGERGEMGPEVLAPIAATGSITLEKKPPNSADIVSSANVGGLGDFGGQGLRSVRPSYVIYWKGNVVPGGSCTLEAINGDPEAASSKGDAIIDRAWGTYSGHETEPNEIELMGAITLSEGATLHPTKWEIPSEDETVNVYCQSAPVSNTHMVVIPVFSIREGIEGEG